MTNNVLFEIGIEELPARFIDKAQLDLTAKTEEWLDKSRIDYEKVTSYSTPRRLAILIENIAEYQETVVEEVRGPSEKIAKDDSGEWSKAAIGFTKGQGKSVDDIYFKDIKGTNYIFIEKKTEGKASVDILPEFKDIITSLQFPQTMRWGSLSFRFPRPIRWLLAIHNDSVIPFEIANVKTGNKTYGHRFLGNEATITDPLSYERTLEENFVIADAKKREEIIVEQIKAIEEAEKVNVIIEQDLLNEVRNLVEYPTAFVGSFKEDYLSLPSEVLITSMKEHQRYFPVKNDKDELKPLFIGVRNGDKHEIDSIVRGNEKVLRARLADGQFFFDEDQKNSIDDYLERLKSVVFQEKIGSLSDKVEHIMTITNEIAKKLNIDEETRSLAKRAAQISKFDLVTNMVDEFPELQGVMGEKYALNFGEKKEVAQALREHYLPKQANGALPESLIGSLVSVADKLDTIIGTISIGLLPTGSQDPYGLRRQAIGVLRIVENEDWNITIEELVDIAIKVYDIQDEEVLASIAKFFNQRAAYLLSEANIEQDVIRAVLHEEIGDFSYTRAKAALLSEKRQDATFKQAEESFVRVLNITAESEEGYVDPILLEHESESDLFELLLEVEEDFADATKARNAEEALQLLEKLAMPIYLFFEQNMVMDEIYEYRHNRLALVGQISKLLKEFADFKVIEWKQYTN